MCPRGWPRGSGPLSEPQDIRLRAHRSALRASLTRFRPHRRDRQSGLSPSVVRPGALLQATSSSLSTAPLRSDTEASLRPSRVPPPHAYVQRIRPSSLTTCSRPTTTTARTAVKFNWHAAHGPIVHRPRLARNPSRPTVATHVWPPTEKTTRTRPHE